MILPIVAFGSPILRKKCVKINKDYIHLNSLIDDMWETMYNASGVGLAAPQIGKDIRLFIIDTTSFCEDDKSEEPLKKVFINASIISEQGQDWEFNEGCLSVPEIREDINRKETITIEYFDASFNKHVESYSGITARIIQHEFDHINGILFIDKISPLRKRMIKSKLIEISKGKIDPAYKMLFPK